MKKASARAQKKKYIVITALIVIILLLFTGMYFIKEMRRSRVTVQYEEEIRRYAYENALEPAYVASVIMAESSYRPAVVSSANARGLMQLLPETAEDMARVLGETYEEDALFDPDTNIRYGCRYLRWLMDYLPTNDIATTSAAYFQGPSAVRRMLQDPEYSVDGAKLDSFGTANTENYVAKILKYYKEYKRIYA